MSMLKSSTMYASVVIYCSVSVGDSAAARKGHGCLVCLVGLSCSLSSFSLFLPLAKVMFLSDMSLLPTGLINLIWKI